MITLGQFIEAMESIAPQRWAESWDPVGLQIGDPGQQVTCVVCSLDLTEQALQLAAAHRAELILTHHPAIFHPLSRLISTEADQHRLLRLIREGRALFAAHTNLDAAPGGTADALADFMELGVGWQPVFPFEAPDEPAEGGHGRWLELGRSIRLSELYRRLISRPDVPFCRYFAWQDRAVHRLGVFPGAFDETWLDGVTLLGLDLVVSGEFKYHVQQMLAERQIASFELGHDVSERVVWQPLSQRLRALLPDVDFVIAAGIDYNKLVSE